MLPQDRRRPIEPRPSPKAASGRLPEEGAHGETGGVGPPGPTPRPVPSRGPAPSAALGDPSGLRRFFSIPGPDRTAVSGDARTPKEGWRHIRRSCDAPTPPELLKDTPSSPPEESLRDPRWEERRDEIVGLGRRSIHKSYYAQLQGRMAELEELLEGTIAALATMGEIRDPYTGGHQRRVAHLAAAIARKMGIPPHQLETVRIAGMLHDIGKISVPIEILNKPRTLSPSEFAIVKIHPEAGFEILKGIHFRGPVAEAVLQHHERLDGSGYPGGLREGKILLEAKILAVADIVEAMAYHRPYRPALGVPAAMQEILALRERGRLCPEAVTACLSLFEGGADPMNDEDERTGGIYP